MAPLLLRRRVPSNKCFMFTTLAISCLIPQEQQQHCCSVSAFTPNQLLRKITFDPKKNKFFSVEHFLPPLEEDMVGPLLMSFRSNSTEGPSSIAADTTTTTTTTTSLTLPYSSQEEENGGGGSDAPLHVLYTNDPKMVNQWLMENVPMEGCAIGFDTESVPDAPWIDSKFKGRPVTVQLATSESSIVIPLLRNKKYNKACIPLLEAVLSDENIVKCGCSIDDDMLDLKRLVPGFKHLEARSRLDLGLLGVSKNRLGLKKLTSILLHRNLEKPKKLAASDWSRSPLTNEQLAYGARDAWAGAAVLEELERLDPETFSSNALVELLQSQPTLEELNESKVRKKQAKELLSKLNKSYYEANTDMPPAVQEKVDRLRCILKETQTDLNNSMESFGFIPDEARVGLKVIEDHSLLP